MRIIIDGMGGDFAPLEPLRGAAEAVRELGVEMIVTGRRGKAPRLRRGKRNPARRHHLC